MTQITTLTEFLEATGTQLQCYEMGRRIGLISRDEFLNFELTEKPYPKPLQQQAWLGLLFQDLRKAGPEPLIWFIRFPLDEQGKLVLAARDDFLHRLLEAVGHNLQAGENSAKMQTALENNPYVFQPKPERMAVFHATVTNALKQPASHFYAHAQDYFSGKLGWEQWTFLGYQGIADLAARLDQNGNADTLTKAIPQLPPSPLEALCHCLENAVVTPAITRALLQQVDATVDTGNPDPQILTACIRGASQSAASNLLQELILRILEQNCARGSDVLAAIAGRAWEVLLDETVRASYLERLAENDHGQGFFDSILSDLLYLPATRTFMLASLRDPQRSARLSQAVGDFFNNIKTP